MNVDQCSDDSINIYLQEIGQVPLLSAAQEVSLAKQIEAGASAGIRLQREDYQSWEERQALEQLFQRGAEARRQLIQPNLRLVVSIARKYPSRGLSIMDMVQEANIALMRAVENFDYPRGHKFSPYAT